MTLQTIREITDCTEDCTAEIMGLGLAQLTKVVGTEQRPILELRNDDGKDEMEDVSKSGSFVLDAYIFASGKEEWEGLKFGKEGVERRREVGVWADVDRSLQPRWRWWMGRYWMR